jgi:hypothetical protein
MTAWTRLECAGDKLSARAIFASGRIVARSDEALEVVRLRGRAAIPTPIWRPVSLRIADIVWRFLRPVMAYFGM